MEISKFVVNNWYLFLGLAFVIGMLIVEPLRRAKYRYTYVAPAQAVTVINRENAVVIDTRDASEFNTGHIVNALNIPHAKLVDPLTDLSKYKNRPIIVVCRNGQISPKAAVALRKRGSEDVRVLSGGIKAWTKAQLPVEK